MKKAMMAIALVLLLLGVCACGRKQTQGAEAPASSSCQTAAENKASSMTPQISQQDSVSPAPSGGVQTVKEIKEDATVHFEDDTSSSRVSFSASPASQEPDSASSTDHEANPFDRDGDGFLDGWF